MVCCYVLETCYDRREAVREIDEFLEGVVVGCFTREAHNIFETGMTPVINNEDGQKTGADGIQPPNIGAVSDEGEEQ